MLRSALGSIFSALRVGCLDFGGRLPRGVENALEAGGDAEQQEDQEQPGLRAEPAVEQVADAGPDGDRDPHLEPQRRVPRSPKKGPRRAALVLTSVVQAGRVL